MCVKKIIYESAHDFRAIRLLWLASCMFGECNDHKAILYKVNSLSLVIMIRIGTLDIHESNDKIFCLDIVDNYDEKLRT